MADKYDFRKMENIRVICRFRPRSETEKREEKMQKMEDSEPKFRSVQEVALKRPKGAKQTQFKAVLDHMFRPSTTQKKMFDIIGRPMVQAVLEGYNATIFAYGQTGSGKTFTMFGPEKKKDAMNLGLVQRCCTYLFDKLKKLSNGVDPDVVEWHVSASFIQIYKERLSDLLDPKQTARLQIRTNFQTDTPYVENLKSVSLNNLEDILIHLSIAFSNRIVASHKLNSESSRSHMLLSLEVEQKTKEGAVKRSKLNFGDLAGSEDIRRALGDNPDPERMKEAIAINSSLTALTTAINNLSKGQRPSYRSSALTHILQDSLGGNSKTTMIVAASPAVYNRAETIRTLRFAMTAKTVKNEAKINKEFTRAQLMRRINELESQNAKLKGRVIELETQMQAAGMDVELSTDLYGDEEAVDWSDGDEDDDDHKSSKKKNKKGKKGAKANANATNGDNTANANGAKNGAKKGGKKKNKTNLTMESGDGVNKVSSHQIDVLKKEIDHMNTSLKTQQDRNKELEKRTMDLSSEIDSVTQQLQSTRETLDQTNKRATNFGKERQQLETRVDTYRKEMAQNQASYSKQQNDLDRQIQRQRNNITMQISEKKDLQKQVKQLNLTNEHLLKQNEMMEQQMSAIKRSAFKNNPEAAQKAFANDEATQNLIKELDAMSLKEEEAKMAPADLLLYRFAAQEANDFRLTQEQRMKKTAKMMNDLSTDINDLMEQWLPKKKTNSSGRKVSSALVFNVRTLIGHFNVLVGQMKMNESNFQNDLRLDIKRRDQEIKKLKEENRLVHQLQDDMAEKDEIILQLKKSRDDLKVERDNLMTQTDEQRDMLFDVQNQVRYLDSELNTQRATIVEMKKLKVATSGDQGLDLASLEDADESTGSSEDEYEPPKKQKSPKKQQTPPKHYKQDSDEVDEVIELSSEHNNNNSNSNIASPSHKNNSSVIIHDDHDEKDEEQDQYTPINIDKKRQQSHSKKRRKSTMSMWREDLKPGNQLDCKDESGLWWTAKIVGFKGNGGNRLQIRYDGWGDQYDEVIDRSSDRLAVYKSKFHTKKGGKKLIREGMMQKEGKMFKTWRKRYFTLDDTGAMSYYHNKGDENSIGSFDVKLMKKTERASFGRNKQYGLCLHTENRVWKFLCANEKDLAEWIHAINFVKRGQFEEDD